jgi:hypothetical protein
MSALRYILSGSADVEAPQALNASGGLAGRLVAASIALSPGT